MTNTGNDEEDWVQEFLESAANEASGQPWPQDTPEQRAEQSALTEAMFWPQMESMFSEEIAQMRAEGQLPAHGSPWA